MINLSGVPEYVVNLINKVSVEQPRKKWTVYVHVSKLDGRKYVGMTSQKPSKRWHKSAYICCPFFYEEIERNGFDSFFSVPLLYFDDKEHAENAERFFIKYWNTQNQQYGFNVDDGGLFSGRLFSPSGMESIRRTLDKYREDRKRKVTVFDLEGHRLFESPSIAECARTIKCQRTNLEAPLRIGHGTIIGKYIVRYSDEVVGIEQLSQDDIRRPNEIRSRNVPVNQYDLNGKYICTFPSFGDASKKFKGKPSMTNIYSAVIRHQSAYGYQWRFAKNNDTQDIDPYIPSTSNKPRRVDMIDPDTGKVIKTFNSISEAQTAMGFPKKKMIIAVLVGQVKCGLAYGYKWAYTPGEE